MTIKEFLTKQDLTPVFERLWEFFSNDIPVDENEKEPFIQWHSDTLNKILQQRVIPSRTKIVLAGILTPEMSFKVNNLSIHPDYDRMARAYNAATLKLYFSNDKKLDQWLEAHDYTLETNDLMYIIDNHHDNIRDLDNLIEKQTKSISSDDIRDYRKILGYQVPDFYLYDRVVERTALILASMLNLDTSLIKNDPEHMLQYLVVQQSLQSGELVVNEETFLDMSAAMVQTYLVFYMNLVQYLEFSKLFRKCEQQ